MPSISPFNTMSINTRSGLVCSATFMASDPDEAIWSTSYPRLVSRDSSPLAMMISSSTTSTLGLVMLRLPPFLVKEFLESDVKQGTVGSLDFHFAVKLLSQVPHQLETQRLGILQAETEGQTHS